MSAKLFRGFSKKKKKATTIVTPYGLHNLINSSNESNEVRHVQYVKGYMFNIVIIMIKEKNLNDTTLAWK